MAQDLSAPRISKGVKANPPDLIVLEPVRCLECGKGYPKPTSGGTLSTNPGCPHCGYLGWLPLSASINAPWRHDRSAADRLQRRLAPVG
jgi:hypothetical protein